MPQPFTDTGISENDRKELAEALSVVLANTHALSLKTHFFHWNITGFHFHALHAMFDDQYEELAHVVDDIAERIRALGVVAPGSYTDFLELSTIAETRAYLGAEAAVKQLLEDHEASIIAIRPLIGKAEEANDIATADLLTQRLAAHEKTAWMLRSTLEA